MLIINKIKYIIIFALFGINFNVFAQGGSNYSIFGFGDISNAISAGYEGTAGTSIAIPSEYSVNFANPALLSFVNSTRIQVGYRFNQNIVSDSKTNIWQNNGSINGLTMVFAFDTAKKVAASFGLIPQTKVNYSIAKSFLQNSGADEISGISYYKGLGGLSAFYGSVSANVFGGLYLGGTLYGNFGSIIYHNSVVYNQNYSYGTYYMQQDFFSGLGYKVGLYYELPLNISLGFFYQDFGNLLVEREKSYSSDLIADTVFSESFKTNSPKILGFGVSYKTGIFTFGADYRILNVSNLDYGFSQNNIFKNSGEFSLGIVRHGNSRTNAPILDRTTYRFGFASNKLYYEVSNQPINELKFSLGAGIPFSSSGMIDAAFVFGKRGTTNNGLVNEYFGRLIIDISIGESWFIPFKREY